MDVFTHIKEEHEKFRGMITKIESAKADKKMGLFKELHAEIHGHHNAEEKVVFPLVMKNVKGEDEEVVLEMIEEHNLGKHQFSVLEKTSVEDETWDAKFSVLKEVLDHHMKEEEGEFIPLARKVVPKEKSVDILEEFETILKKHKKEKQEKLGM